MSVWTPITRISVSVASVLASRPTRTGCLSGGGHDAVEMAPLLPKRVTGCLYTRGPTSVAPSWAERLQRTGPLSSWSSWKEWLYVWHLHTASRRRKARAWEIRQSPRHVQYRHGDRLTGNIFENARSATVFTCRFLSLAKRGHRSNISVRDAVYEGTKGRGCRRVERLTRFLSSTLLHRIPECLWSFFRTFSHSRKQYVDANGLKENSKWNNSDSTSVEWFVLYFDNNSRYRTR